MWHENDGDEQVKLPFISFLEFPNAKDEPSKTFTFIFFLGFPNACNKLVELTFIFSWDFWMLVMNQHSFLEIFLVISNF